MINIFRIFTEFFDVLLVTSSNTIPLHNIAWSRDQGVWVRRGSTITSSTSVNVHTLVMKNQRIDPGGPGHPFKPRPRVGYTVRAGLHAPLPPDEISRVSVLRSPMQCAIRWTSHRPRPYNHFYQRPNLRLADNCTWFYLLHNFLF
jgi:hypothetical protein